MADNHPVQSRRVRFKEEFLVDHQASSQPPQMKCSHRESQKSTVVERVEEAETKEDYDDIPYLSGKPFFDMVLSKSHVSPRYDLQFPARIVRQLPSAKTPAVLRYNCKNWNTAYFGNYVAPRLDSGWRNFVNDNGLVMGDACVFEVMESSHTNIKFKVHVLRSELPPELLAAIDSRGSAENPINID